MRISSLAKPEFLFNPRQIALRLLRQWAAPKPLERVPLPWDCAIDVRPDESVGRAIWTWGIFDLCVSEMLFRLTGPGDNALDVGANIGYMSSLLASRAGPKGRVDAFEPHPEVFQELLANTGRWSAKGKLATIHAHSIALSESTGSQILSEPSGFYCNRGLAALAESPTDAARTFKVQSATLDQWLSDRRAEILKIDVEGTELSVLKGGRTALSERRIRDIIFEDHRPYPTAATAFLEDLNYHVFSMRVTLSGPSICPAANRCPPLRPLDSQSFLATLDPDRLRSKAGARGWRCLKRSRLK